MDGIVDPGSEVRPARRHHPSLACGPHHQGSFICVLADHSSSPGDVAIDAIESSDPRDGDGRRLRTGWEEHIVIGTESAPSHVDTAGLIRNAPVQARSAARLTALLDAAAGLAELAHYERLTTAMVAERAGASIGTVYRYFPDRIAVLQSLAARNADRMTERILLDIADERHGDAMAALQGGLAVLVDAFRTEPGFASLRFGDVLDLRPADSAVAYSVLASQILAALTSRFGLPAHKDLPTALETTVIAIDAIAARAFAGNGASSAAFLAQGPKVSSQLLGEYLSAR
jgi:AcrR family transcriptional regulator